MLEYTHTLVKHFFIFSPVLIGRKSRLSAACFFLLVTKKRKKLREKVTYLEISGDNLRQKNEIAFLVFERYLKKIKEKRSLERIF